MAKVKTTRKQLFRAALALADLTMAEWAEREGITPSYLSQVVLEHLSSDRLNAKIDAFIAEQFSKHAALVA